MAYMARVCDGGWLAVVGETEGREIRLRLEENEAGRLVIVEFWMVEPQGSTGATFRDLPLRAVGGDAQLARRRRGHSRASGGRQGCKPRGGGRVSREARRR